MRFASLGHQQRGARCRSVGSRLLWLQQVRQNRRFGAPENPRGVHVHGAAGVASWCCLGRRGAGGGEPPGPGGGLQAVGRARPGTEGCGCPDASSRAATFGCCGKLRQRGARCWSLWRSFGGISQSLVCGGVPKDGLLCLFPGGAGRPSRSVPQLAVPRRGAGGKDPSFPQRRHSEAGRCGGQQRRPCEMQNPGRQSWRQPRAPPLSCESSWGRPWSSGSRFAPGQCLCGCFEGSQQGRCRVAGFGARCGRRGFHRVC